MEQGDVQTICRSVQTDIVQPFFFFFFITIILQDFFFLFEVSLYSGVGQTSGIY